MGCCASSSLDDKKQNHFSSCASKSPPPLEEETVKEVLSETPKPPKLPLNDGGGVIPTKCRPFLEQKLPNLVPHFQHKKLTSMEQKLIPPMAMQQSKYYHPDPTTTPEPEPEEEEEEEISEVSEMCSLSESISTTTPEDQHHHVQLGGSKYRSQGQNSLFRNYNNPGSGSGRSPARRAGTDPSPPRRYPSTGRVGQRRDAVGENSARRSRSPATRSNVSRSPSGRRAGPSPGRVRMVRGPDEVGRRRRRDDADADANADVDEWGGPEESLENPLVSLECFIFL